MCRECAYLWHNLEQDGAQNILYSCCASIDNLGHFAGLAGEVKRQI